MHGNLAVFIPIVAIIASTYLIAIMMKYGFRGRRASPVAGEAAENVRLTHENEELRHMVGRLEERLQVLERIATDPAERTAREIERLR
jgi:hypothetical protein